MKEKDSFELLAGNVLMQIDPKKDINVFLIDPEDAANLPGMLGRIAPKYLRLNGTYQCKINGYKVCFKRV